MKIIDYTKPVRQSSKGVLVIFALNAYKFIRHFFVFFIAIGLTISKKESFKFLTVGTLITIGIIILLIILIVAVLRYLNFKFHLTSDEFHLSTGIINKDITIIPKSKIQNVYIKQNFIQQLINVVGLNIETAGDEKSEIHINALDKPTALRLKKELFNKILTKDSDSQVDDSSTVFYRISTKRLILEGISQNHLRSFAIITSFVFGLYYEFRDYVKEQMLLERFKAMTHFDNDSFISVMITGVFMILFALLLSLLFSIIKTFIINFNLEVLEHKKTIEINKGLFNKISLSLTPSRIQNIIIKTNRIKAYFGLYTLSVKQAMVHAKQQKNFVIVAMNKQQIEHLVKKLYKTYETISEVYKPQLYYKRILAYRMLIVIMILNLVAYMIFKTNFWLINIVLGLISVLYVNLKYKKAYYQIDADYVTVGRGFIDRVTEIFEIHKIQSIVIKQSVFQKRKQIASLEISTASEDVTIPYIKEDEAKRIYNFLLFKVESQDKDWM
ncbi:PH domain-containing protein [Psychroserpens algicola]|uniref:PH domain-containing protein n=1 Tax=Psychroserpens algicola TaxID=1719034 RepID=UPI001952CD1D|nr:PH domain-containing protein [Psychroserpens algicola]